jgi:hypothetical protein
MITDTSTQGNLDQAVETLTKSSIDLAEAASNYGALKVIFGVFMIVVILMIIMFVYQIYSISSKINTINTAAVKTQDYFEGVADKTIGINEGQILVRRAMNCLATMIKYTILRIKLENHIDNVEAVKIKVKKLIHNEYTELNAFLAHFICNDRPLNEVLKEEDWEELEKLVLDQVYLPKEEFSVFLMDQSVDIYLNGIKLIYLKKV